MPAERVCQRPSRVCQQPHPWRPGAHLLHDGIAVGAAQHPRAHNDRRPLRPLQLLQQLAVP